MSAITTPARSAWRLTPYRLASPGLLLAGPAIALMAILMIAPLIVVFGLSLTDYSLGAAGTAFVGLKNYAAIAADRRAVLAIGHTLAYVAIVVPAAVSMGLALALAIQGRRHLRHMYEVLFFLPATSTFVAMALVWQFLLHGRIGPINEWLAWAGWGRIDFLTDPATALPTLAAIGAWQLVGQTTILFLAGLASVPADIYEAAALDGMEPGWDRLLRVTLPMLGPTILFVVVTTTITAFQAFDGVAALTQGGPAGSTETLLYKIYAEAYRYLNMGYASALSVLFLICIAALSLAQIVLAEKKVHYA